jgi:hypothetical protein
MIEEAKHRPGLLYLRSMRALVVFTCFALACHGGGTYGASGRPEGTVDRGETNGRQFDFVTNKPDGDDWQIRVRGGALWAAYSKGDKSDQLGTANLTEQELTKLWDLVDALAIPSRTKGKQDPDEGYVTLRLREPGDEQHDIYTVYVPRDEPGEDVETLAVYLQKLISKYFREKPNF